MAGPTATTSTRAANTKAALAPVARLNTGNLIRVETVADLQALAELLWRGGASRMANLDRPEKVARVILAGMEVGLSPAQSLDSIWMGENGKTSIWGDGALALVRASGLLESFKEWVDGEGDARTGHCEAKRAGVTEPMHKTFTIAEAKQAGLIERAKGKGPWATYPDRQLQMRARGFLLRDMFTDVLKGLVTTEELQDYHSDAVTVTVTGVKADAPRELPYEGPRGGKGMKDPVTGQITYHKPADSSEQAAPPVAAQPAQLDGPVTDEQLAAIAEIRRLLLVSKGPLTPDEQKAAWAEVLGAYGVKSAREFTAAKAAEFVAAEWEKVDPFTTPPTASSPT